MNHYFGYAKQTANEFGIFDYNGKAKEEHVLQFEGFKKQNEITMKGLLEDRDKKKATYTIGVDEDKEFSILKDKNAFWLERISLRLEVE